MKVAQKLKSMQAPITVSVPGFHGRGVVNVIADSVRNINWKNFKNQVHDYERHKAYEDCWQSMHTLQEQGRKMEFCGGGEDYVDDDLDDRP